MEVVKLHGNSKKRSGIAVSYEMKDILKTMVDNNEPHWTADTMNMVRAELEHVYAQAPKADELQKQIGILLGVLDTLKINLEYYKKKADEYEKNNYRAHVNSYKAEAFDAILKAYDEASSEGQMVYEFSNIIEKYESGESE